MQTNSIISLVVGSLIFSAGAEVLAQTSVRLPIAGLSRYIGKPVPALLKDADIRGPIEALIPNAEKNCWRNVVNSFPVLKPSSDGGVQTALLGTKQHQGKEAFLSVSPSGEINLVLQCYSAGTTGKEFLFLTNMDTKLAPSADLLDWFWVVDARRGSVVRKNRNFSEVYIIPQAPRPTVSRANASAGTQNAFVLDTRKRTYLSGLWRCSLTPQRSTQAQESLFFNRQGDFVSLSGAGRYQGIYTIKANQIMAKIPIKGPKNSTTYSTFTLTPFELSSDVLNLSFTQFAKTRNLYCQRDPKYKSN